MNRFDYERIPVPMLESLQWYVTDGRRPGHFLTAVLSNDLKNACARADDVNIALLPVYVAYLYNDAPANCWGSYAMVDAWIAEHAEAATTGANQVKDEPSDALIEEIAVFVSHLRDDYLSELQSVKSTARQIREQFVPSAAERRRRAETL